MLRWLQRRPETMAFPARRALSEAYVSNDRAGRDTWLAAPDRGRNHAAEILQLDHPGPGTRRSADALIQRFDPEGSTDDTSASSRARW